MSKKAFKVGDRVRSIKGVGFNEVVGAIGVVERVNDSFYDPQPYGVVFESGIEGHNNFECNSNSWWCRESEIELISNPSIHITVDNNKTIAVMKEDKQEIGRGVATCNPTDEFDFKVGAKLAMDRLLGEEVKVVEESKDGNFTVRCIESYSPGEWLTKGKMYKFINGIMAYDDGFESGARYDTFSEYCSGNIELGKCLELVANDDVGVREVKRKAKVGEYIKIINKGNHEPELVVGDIHKVTDEESYKIKTNKQNVFYNNRTDEYVVLEYYNLEKPEPRESIKPDEPKEEYRSFKKAKRRAKVGEYMLVVNAENVPGDDYMNGDIIKCISRDSYHEGYAEGMCGGRLRVIHSDEYVVLEGYQPPKTFDSSTENTFTKEQVLKAVEQALDK